MASVGCWATRAGKWSSQSENFSQDLGQILCEFPTELGESAPALVTLYLHYELHSNHSCSVVFPSQAQNV